MWPLQLVLQRISLRDTTHSTHLVFSGLRPLSSCHCSRRKRRWSEAFISTAAAASLILLQIEHVLFITGGEKPQVSFTNVPHIPHFPQYEKDSFIVGGGGGGISLYGKIPRLSKDVRRHRPTFWMFHTFIADKSN